MNEEMQNKDSYDELLSFSRITPENWSLPDHKNYMPADVTKENWAGPFLKPRLDATVPQGIVQLFEVARGCMLYSWFFYPLATLGAEQCMRVGELAVWERCRMLQKESEHFFSNLQTLLAAGVISTGDESRFQAMRRLRNTGSHLKNLTLLDPGMAITALNDTVELINRMFSAPAEAAMDEDDEISEDDDGYPWEDVEASRNDERLQRQHPMTEAKRLYLDRAKPCPQCGCVADGLAWFYFESPPETWEGLCGCEGWITVCDRCHRQVDFFAELRS